MKKLALVIVAACGGTSAKPVPPPTPTAPDPVPVVTPPPPPAPKLRGALIEDLDRSADPCVDFFQFANGTWRKQHPIPASQPKWSRRWESGEVNKEKLKQLLEDVAAQHATSGTAQIVGDFYGACMDEAAADAAGATPLAGALADIDAIKTRADVIKMFATLHFMGVDVGFRFGAQQDPHAPEHVIADVGPGGLGLPDRDYYLKPDKRFVEARAKYAAHVDKLFALAGRKEKAAAVIQLETELAKATLDNVAQRDPAAHDHPTKFAALPKTFDWAGYYAAVGVAPGDLNVDEPKFLAAFDQLLVKTPVATWKAYFAAHLIGMGASYLSKPFVDEDFAFNEQFLQGATELKPRWKRCAEWVDSLFGDALGKQYVAKFFPPEAKARVTEMVKNILLATGDAIHDAAWMSDATKQRALGKLATFNPKIGYPEVWKDYTGVVVKRDALVADVAAGARFNVMDDHAQIGKPVDRKRFGMTPPTSNAYYNPQLNEIVFPAGILVPPGFDMGASDAVNYGSIGVVIGHEVSHGFDDQGAKYDEKGALANWWTKDDFAKFEERGKCIVDQFDGYFIEPTIHHNGKLVLGESIGDLGGVAIAWRGYQRSLAGRDMKTAPTIDGFTPEQQFFLGFAQWRGDETRPETQRLMVQGDPHPVAKYRVIGPLSNTPAFAKAFSCKAGQPMVRETRCQVW